MLFRSSNINTPNISPNNSLRGSLHGSLHGSIHGSINFNNITTYNSSNDYNGSYGNIKITIEDMEKENTYKIQNDIKNDMLDKTLANNMNIVEIDMMEEPSIIEL